MINRIKVEPNSRAKLFSALEQSMLTIDTIAEIIGVSSRTIRDWRRGKYTIPQHHFDELTKLACVNDKSLQTTSLPSWWYTSDAGKRGGRAFIEKYKTFGTPQGRALGGRNSYKSAQGRLDSIFERTKVVTPRPSCELAEFVGVLIGDGSINKYQVTVSLDLLTDRQYSLYVARLIQNLFGLEPAVYLRPKARCIVLAISSANLSEYLVGLGLPLGHKLRGRLDIPEWILQNEQYAINCVRGIFDTDGSVFQERHRYRDRSYSYCRLSLVSMSDPLRESVLYVLEGVGINAKIRSSRSVSIERFTDIENYFRIVGSSNPKHLERWSRFGGVG